MLFFTKNKFFITTLTSLFLLAGLSSCGKKKVKNKVQDLESSRVKTVQDIPSSIIGSVDGAIGDLGLNAGTIGGPMSGALPVVYFDYDSFSLTQSSKAELSSAANWLISDSSARIQIEGHTDERGSTEYNLALGEKRAQVVKNYLQSLGIPASRMSTISYGEERPNVIGAGDTSWSANRRAEFQISQ